MEFIHLCKILAWTESWITGSSLEEEVGLQDGRLDHKFFLSRGDWRGDLRDETRELMENSWFLIEIIHDTKLVSWL